MSKINNELLKDYPDVLTVKMVMDILGIGKTYTYKLLQTNLITSIKIGRSYRIFKTDLISYLLNKK